MRQLHRALGILACVAGVAPAFVPGSAALTARPPSATSRRPVLPFLHDDYTRAVAQARARRVPLFIEAWAPW